MQYGLSREEQAKLYACHTGLILDGFSVAEDHSIVLCETGREWYYSEKRADQRKIVETRERRR